MAPVIKIIVQTKHLEGWQCEKERKAFEVNLSFDTPQKNLFQIVIKCLPTPFASMFKGFSSFGQSASPKKKILKQPSLK